ncbi:hypothetical protein ARMGADRAFT_84357 [Armillaria gallica]|uniref:Uncharacterized protein n=1 Tax=Armillaria gallica TaxID=47427 RepID=A0A2H3CP31_ARMGA|nr:hypothetical protein ARMGADRAFT_84357 [Armillaria gallica]
METFQVLISVLTKNSIADSAQREPSNSSADTCRSRPSLVESHYRLSFTYPRSSNTCSFISRNHRFWSRYRVSPPELRLPKQSLSLRWVLSLTRCPSRSLRYGTSNRFLFSAQKAAADFMTAIWVVPVLLYNRNGSIRTHSLSYRLDCMTAIRAAATSLCDAI